MSALSLTYTLTNGTTADASQVQQDFTDIVNYVNTDVIRTDGTNAMAAQLTLTGSDPTNANHAARKSYVDGLTLRAHGSTSQAFTADNWTTVAFSTVDEDTASAYSANAYHAQTDGVYLVAFTIEPPDSDTTPYFIRVSAGGSTYDGPALIPNSVNTEGSSVSPLHMAVPVRVTAAQTITPQVLIHGGSPTRSLGSWFAVTWLHG